MTATSTLRRDDVDRLIAELAARQHNAFTRVQALDGGMAATTVRRRVRSGRWGAPLPGVYTIAGAPPTWLHHVWCAYLAAGPTAVVTHESALHLHGLHLQPRHPITLTVSHGGHHRLRGVFVHQIDDLRPHRVTEVAGLPVSTPERAVVEVAATLGRRRLADVLDEAVAARRTSYGKVAACLQEVARPRKPGVATLGRVLDERSEGPGAPASALERDLAAALRAGGLPAPVRQHPLPGRGAIEGLVDAAYVDARLILEADGRRWHTRIRDLKKDHDRDTEAARVGWQTLRLLYEEIVHHPMDVCSAVADVLAQRGPRVTRQ